MTRTVTFEVDGLQLTVSTQHRFAVVYTERHELKRGATTSTPSVAQGAMRKLIDSDELRVVALFDVRSGNLIARITNE